MDAEIIDAISSKLDKTVKFICRLEDGLIAEVAYINKNDGKDILCVSSQTGCDLGCRFCHTSDAKGKVVVRSLMAGEIFWMVKLVYEKLDLASKHRMLLVSYMGCGEPMLNWDNVISSMVRIRNRFSPSRFALATLIPTASWHRFFESIHYIQDESLNVKMHLSLHFTRDDVRKGWMPAAMPIEPSIAALEFYNKFLKQPVEIHYTLIDDVNDSDEEAHELGELLSGRDIPVKFLQYNRRETLNCEPSNRLPGDFMNIVIGYGVKCEYYVPPGADVGSSCGAFLLDYYLKYNVR